MSPFFVSAGDCPHVLQFQGVIPKANAISVRPEMEKTSRHAYLRRHACFFCAFETKGSAITRIAPGGPALTGCFKTVRKF